MREVLYIANSEGLKCEEYKLMKNKRYLSDVPEKLSTASPDSIPPARVCFCDAKVSEFHDAFFSSDHFANFATFAKGSTYPLLLFLN